MREKQTAMNPPFKVYNFKTSRVLFFSFAPYLVILLLLYRNLPSEEISGTTAKMSVLYWLLVYWFHIYFAVFTFYESHFEMVCPFRPFWRKASYPYQSVSELYFYTTKYPSVAVFFKEEKKRRHIWSILADLAGDEKNMENLTAFLSTKGVEVTSFY